MFRGTGKFVYRQGIFFFFFYKLLLLFVSMRYCQCDHLNVLEIEVLQK